MTSNINVAIKNALASLQENLFGTVHYVRVIKEFCEDRRNCRIYRGLDEAYDTEDSSAGYCTGHTRVAEEVRGMLRGCYEVPGRNVAMTILPWEEGKLGRKRTLIMRDPECYSARFGLSDDGYVTWSSPVSSFGAGEYFEFSPWRP